MFRFRYRPSERIWDNSILTKRLARYRDILLGKRVARYLIAKKIAVEEFEGRNVLKIFHPAALIYTRSRTEDQHRFLDENRHLFS